MGLDLSALGKQVRQMSHSAAAQATDTAARAAQARARYLVATGEEERWAAAADLSRETAAWLLARPVEPLDTTRDLPPRPPAYTMVATDGSQIELDRHGSVPCYVINIGRVFLRYGHAPAARLSSQPTLC